MKVRTPVKLKTIQLVPNLLYQDKRLDKVAAVQLGKCNEEKSLGSCICKLGNIFLKLCSRESFKIESY